MPIKILTLNTAMLPEYPPFLTESGKAKRAKKLAEQIYKENYHIVCLQEMFSEDMREIFFNKLKTKFPFIKKKTGEESLWVQDSGLFFASMMPFKGKPGDIIFSTRPVGSDGQSQKGCSYARLDLTSEGYKDIQLYCFNTHLQSSKSNDDIRKIQLREIKSKMLELFLLRSPELKNENMAMILFGDLNIIGNPAELKNKESEYSKMIDLFEYPRDLFVKKNLSAGGSTWDGKANTFIRSNDSEDKDQERLDYALAFDSVPTGRVDGPRNSIRKIECISCVVKKFKDENGKDLSDHYGLELVIDL